MPKVIHVLAFPKVQLLDVTGPLQVFASANDIVRHQGLPAPYAPTVIASGGVAGIADIRILSLHADEGIEGVITGRALYDGRLDLKAAMAVARAAA